MRNIKFFLSKIKKTHIIYALLCIFVFTACTSFCVSYYSASGFFSATSTDVVNLTFVPNINNNDSFNQSIDLASTITNDKTLAPGARGSFRIRSDLNQVNYDVHYEISFDGTNIPANLHFYTDQRNPITSRFTTISGNILQQYTGNIDVRIYWSWDYYNNPESNQNDNMYMNQDIVVPFSIAITKKTN